MVWKCFVLPGVDETLTFFSPSNELMVLDFPTLGYPTRPIESFEGGFPLWSRKSGDISVSNYPGRRYITFT